MYKEDLALNNLQWLICHKIQPNQSKPHAEKIHLKLHCSTLVFQQVSGPNYVRSKRDTISLLTGKLGCVYVTIFWCGRVNFICWNPPPQKKNKHNRALCRLF